MSLEKAIKHKKEHRKPRRYGSVACKNHGSCNLCRTGRVIRTIREKMRAIVSRDDAFDWSDYVWKTCDE